MNQHEQAYVHGFTTKLAQHGVSPAAFVRAAYESGNPGLMKVAGLVKEAIDAQTYVKHAGLRDSFVRWAQDTSPIMKPLTAARNGKLHALADAGKYDEAAALSRYIGPGSPIGKLTQADEHMSRRLGLLPPRPDAVTKETQMTMEQMRQLGLL